LIRLDGFKKIGLVKFGIDERAAMTQKYRAVIIGAGKIAVGYDNKHSSKVLTHVHALMLQDHIHCAGVFDVNKLALQDVVKKWGVKTYDTFDSLMSVAPDLVVIAVPDELHEKYLNLVLPYKPKIVICEKPLTLNYESSRVIVQRYSDSGIPLVVNFQRRFDSAVLSLKKRLEDNDLGRPLGGALWYSKGIIHNGSHAIDLFSFLFGDVYEYSVRDRVFDYHPSDPTVGGTIKFRDIAIELIPGDERLFSLFEIDLLFEKGRFRFRHSGLKYEIFKVEPDPVFEGYSELISSGIKDTGLKNAMSLLYSQVFDFLNSNRAFPYEAVGSLKTQHVVEQMAKTSCGGVFIYEQTKG